MNTKSESDKPVEDNDRFHSLVELCDQTLLRISAFAYTIKKAHLISFFVAGILLGAFL